MSEISGAVKLKDGVFFGDSFAANDIEFVAANKISRIVNCAGREVMNHFESVGVEYLSFNWMDNDAQVIIDSRSSVVNSVSDFIDGALEKGESVLIHSVRGKSRCVTILAAYLMKKFKWKLNKALQFLQSRRSDVAIKAAFHRQLISFERRLALSVDLSSNWDIPPPSNGSCSMDHLIMFNTYINSQVGAQAVLNNSKQSQSTSSCSSDSKRRIAWRDNFQDIRSQLEQESYSSGKIYCVGGGPGPLKSILKKQQVPPSPAAASTAPSTPVLIPCFRPQFSSTGGGPVRVGRTLMTTMTTNNTSLAATVALRTPITNHHVRPPSPMVSRSSPMVSVGRKQSETSSVSVLRQPSPSSQTRHASPSLLSGGSMGIRLSSPSITNFSSSLRQASPSASMSASLRPPSPANKRDLFVRPLAHSQQDLVLARNRTNILAGQVVRRAPSPMTAALQGPLRPMTAPVWRAR